ncbi:MAG: hypothetical protein IT373_36980 [Polyangiaceae bacterium]|nr:hypothetical protein [Polyangiaceae bacterium]
MASGDRWQELEALGDATADLRPGPRFAAAVMDAVRHAEAAAGPADDFVRAAQATADLRPALGFVDAVVSAVGEGAPAPAPSARASGRGEGTPTRARTVRAGLAALALAAAAAVAGLSWSFVAERQLDEAWIAVAEPVGGLE